MSPRGALAGAGCRRAPDEIAPGTDRQRSASRATTLLVALAIAAAVGCRASTERGEPSAGTERGGEVAAAPSAGCRSGVAAEIAGTRQTLAVGGEERTYILDVPAGPADRVRPVLLAFHGFRSNAAEQRAGSGWGERARREGLIAVHPDGHDGVHLLDTTGRGWDMEPTDERDLAFVTAVLDRIEAEHCVDRRRVFATGFSNGGFFANLAACRLAGRLAAVAAVSGSRPLDGCVPTAAIAVLLFHGSADRVVSPALAQQARDWWARRADCGPVSRSGDGCQRYEGCAGAVEYCEGPQGHHWPADANDRMWRFFLAHPRAG